MWRVESPLRQGVALTPLPEGEARVVLFIYVLQQKTSPRGRAKRSSLCLCLYFLNDFLNVAMEGRSPLRQCGALTPFSPETGTLLSASQTFPLIGELPRGRAKDRYTNIKR